jgi:hypothetical protein
MTAMSISVICWVKPASFSGRYRVDLALIPSKKRCLLGHRFFDGMFRVEHRDLTGLKQNNIGFVDEVMVARRSADNQHPGAPWLGLQRPYDTRFCRGAHSAPAG